MKKITLKQYTWVVLVLLILLLIASSHYLNTTFLGIRRRLLDINFHNAGFSGCNTSISTASKEVVRHIQEQIEIGEILPNCGIPKECPENTFPVHVYTGMNKDDEPRLCVLGKYIIGSNVNGGGRGINVAVIEPQRLLIIAVRNFDTYDGDSTELEDWLENDVLPGDIVILFTFDEASKGFGSNAKKILYEIGSGKVQNLHFRSQWYMITQKGIQGFTPYEKLNFAKNSRWAEVINERFCIPKKITGQMVSPDPFPRENLQRTAFCRKFTSSDYNSFCDAELQHEPIMPALLTNRSLIGNQAYSTPVIVVAGSSSSSLLLTLETLVRQPGVNPPSVLVLHSKQQYEVAALVELFNFQSLPYEEPVDGSAQSKLEFGLTAVRGRFPNKKYVIILEEGLLLSPDFMFYMAQLIPIVEKDHTLLGVSAWNPNGYEGLSSNPHLAYRVEEFPGLGYLMPLRVYNNFIEGKFSSCCKDRSHIGWPDIVRESGGHIIIPDVSRVLRRPVDVMMSVENDSDIFLHPRITNLNASAWIDRPQDLVKDRYFQQVAGLMQQSIPLNVTKRDIERCESQHIAAVSIIYEFRGKVYAIYFKEDPRSPDEKLRILARCLKILPAGCNKPRGVYKNILRFTVNRNTVLLVEASSPFYRSKPRLLSPL